MKHANRQALVVGAGLAGAACAVNLVRRGWTVQLLDAAERAAQGASALPVGMLSPLVTRSPTPLSRLSALGVEDARDQLARLVPEGAGWIPTEVVNLGHDPGRKPAALVRPGALVQAWLKEASATGRLQTRWSANAASLTRREADWWIADPEGRSLGHAPVVVIAGAYGTLPLLLPHVPDSAALPLRPVQGQMSFAPLHSEPLVPWPMRNNGVFVPRYEDRALPPEWPSRIWAMGSTYVRGSQDTSILATAHEKNAQSLAEMLPVAADLLRACAKDGSLLGWSQVRCASLDRVPMVGAVPDQVGLNEQMLLAGHRRGRVSLDAVPRLPGLYMLTALGSRGLTLAHWCANWLASRMSGEPSSLGEDNLDLERALDPARFAWKQARRQNA